MIEDELNFNNSPGEFKDPKIAEALNKASEILNEAGIHGSIIFYTLKSDEIRNTPGYSKLGAYTNNISPFSLPALYMEIGSLLHNDVVKFMEDNAEFIRNMAEKNKKDLSEL